MVSRHVYAQVPPKVEYSITPFGRTLEPVILQMQAWGKTSIADRAQAKAYQAEDKQEHVVAP